MDSHQTKQNVTDNVHLQSADTGSESVIKDTKNEPVVGRNDYRGARSRKGAKLTPRLWAGRTKEVRTSGDREDPGEYRRLAAIEGRVYTRPVKRKQRRFISYTH